MFYDQVGCVGVGLGEVLAHGVNQFMYLMNSVIPAKAGIQEGKLFDSPHPCDWIPAFPGQNDEYYLMLITYLYYLIKPSSLYALTAPG